MAASPHAEGKRPDTRIVGNRNSYVLPATAAVLDAVVDAAPLDVLAGAAAGGAAPPSPAGLLLSLVEESPDEESPDEESPDEDSPLPEFADLADEYKSLYQPPPLKLIAGAVSTRSSIPPQCGQTVISVSENFWIFSVCLWHNVHSYS